MGDEAVQEQGGKMCVLENMNSELGPMKDNRASSIRNSRRRFKVGRGSFWGFIICWLLVAATGADAADILHGIPGGAITDATGLFSNPIGGTTYTGEGTWQTYNSANATVTVEGSGTDRRIELFSNWFVRSSSVWYRDDDTTPIDTEWRISTVLAWTGGNGTTNSFRLFPGTDVNGTPDFEVAFVGAAVRWKAGSETGSFISATGLDLTRRTLSISYDPMSGLATANLDEEQIFSVNAGTGLFVKSVLLKHYEFSHNTGTLSVYNISSSPLAAQEMIDSFVYASTPAARAVWTKADAGANVDVVTEDGVPCLALYNAYTSGSQRGSWNKTTALNLSAQDTISLSLKTTRVNSASPILMTVYLYVGGVAHGKFFSLYGEEWATHTLPLSGFSPSLTSDDLKNITRIKFSCWQGTDPTPATVYVSGLLAGNDSANWLHNGSFETTTTEDMPDYWGPTTNRWGTSPQWVLDLDTWRTRWGVDRTVAHSGSNSLRMARFNALDQDMKAVSLERSLSTQTTYTLSAWVRSDTANLPVTFEMWARPASILNIDPKVVTTSSTSNTWERRSFTFTTPVSASSSISTVNCRIYSTSPGTLWIDDVQVEKGVTATTWQPLISDPYIAANGLHRDVPEIADSTITAGGTNLPVVTIDANRRFLVDGQPFIPRAISWEGTPSTHETEHLAKAGFNTIVPFVRSNSNIADVKDFLDDANAKGLKVIIWFWNDMGTALQATWINALKDDYPAIIMWYVADEPYGESDWITANAKYAQAKALDDHDRPVMVNLARDYNVDWDSDVLCMDYYPIGSGVTINQGLKNVGTNVAILHQAAVSAGKPAWNWQQNTGHAYFCYRELTDAEAICQVYQSLVNGSRCIMYFYNKPRLAEQWRATRVLNDEVRQLTSVLYSTDIAPTVTVSPTNNIHLISKRYNGVNYVIAVNDSSRPITATLTIPGTSNALVLFEDRMIYPSNGTFADTFAGYQRHVYRLGNEALSINIDGTDVVLNWSGTEGANYTLQSKGGLADSSWSDEQTNIPGVNGTMSTTTTTTSAESFYRVTSP